MSGRMAKCFDEGLFTTAAFLAQTMLSTTEEKNDGLDADDIVSALLCLAQVAHRETREYRRAIDFYRLAHARWHDAKSNVWLWDRNRFLLEFAQASLSAGNCHETIKLCQEIPHSERSIRVWNLIAAAARSVSNFPLALEAYQAILALEPWSMEAREGLLSLRHVPGLNQPIVVPEVLDSDFLSTFYHAQQQILDFQFQDGIALLKELDRNYRNTTPVQIALAEAYLLNGDATQAMSLYKSLHQKDPSLIDGMDKLAALYEGQGDTTACFKLAESVLISSQHRPEVYLVGARLSRLKSRGNMVMSFVNKALALDPHNHHAYMIQGQQLFDMQKFSDALTSFLKAHQIMPTIYSFQGLVDTHLALHHHKEAFLVARELLKLAKNHPKSLELMGTVFYMTNDLEKARNMFLKSIEKDPKNISVISTIVDVYCANEKYEDAIALVKKVLPCHPTDYMYTRLGDIYLCSKQYEDAMANYSLALTVNHECETAKEGIQRVEKAMQDGNDDTGSLPEEHDSEQDEEFDDFGGDMVFQ